MADADRCFRRVPSLRPYHIRALGPSYRAKFMTSGPNNTRHQLTSAKGCIRASSDWTRIQDFTEGRCSGRKVGSQVESLC